MMKTGIMMLMMLFLGMGTVSAQEKIKIKTSAKCEMCKEKIEGNLKFERGVKFVELDLETKEVTVLYSPKRTNSDKIRKAISELGYDADDVMADKKAHDKLHKCCQKGSSECGH